MEKGFFNENKNIIYLYLSSAVIGLGISVLISGDCVKSWYNYLFVTAGTFLKYIKKENIFKAFFIHDLKYCVIIAIICRSIYRRYLKYILSMAYGFSTGLIVSTAFVSCNLRLGFILLFLYVLKAVFMGLSSLVLYFGKKNTRYPAAITIILLLGLAETFFYIKIVAVILAA